MKTKNSSLSINLKQLLLLTIVVILSSCGTLRTKKLQYEKPQIIIIGAGISGLSAANYLKKNGYDPIVLEAQAKVGGRIKTNYNFEIPFDEGASWIHGPINNPITKLANESGASSFITNDSNSKVYDFNGKAYHQDTLNINEELYNTILNDFKGKSNQSFADVFYEQFPHYKNDRLWTYMLSAYLEFDTGGDISKLSSKDFYDDEAFEGDDVIITNGYDNITNHLAKDITIQLNTVVSGINYNSNKVSLITNNGTYYADKVLITVPLGVLKKKVITFTPPLPEKTQHAIDHLAMGTVNKFLLVWDAPFWDKELQYIGYTPEQKGEFNYFLNLNTFSNTNALMTFAFGEYAKITEQLSDESIIEAIMTHLKHIYGDDIPYPKHFLRTKWNQNPYSFGAYSFATSNGKSKLFTVFENPINDQLFFAGEHTTIDYRGTVHGAYLSGIREARKIIKAK